MCYCRLSTYMCSFNDLINMYKFSTFLPMQFMYITWFSPPWQILNMHANLLLRIRFKFPSKSIAHWFREHVAKTTFLPISVTLYYQILQHLTNCTYYFTHHKLTIDNEVLKVRKSKLKFHPKIYIFLSYLKYKNKTRRAFGTIIMDKQSQHFKFCSLNMLLWQIW